MITIYNFSHVLDNKSTKFKFQIGYVKVGENPTFMNNKNAISYFASFNNGTKDGFYVSNNTKNHFNLGTDLGNHKYEPEDVYH